MKKLFHYLTVVYLVTSPVLILFLIYKTVFLTSKVLELQIAVLGKDAVAMYPTEALDIENTPFIGPLDARVKIFWYTDINCIACRGSFQDIVEVSKIYPEQVVIFFKLLPSESKANLLAHQLMLHAWQSGEFLDLATLLFSKADSLKSSSLEQLKTDIQFPSDDLKVLEAYNEALSRNLIEFQAMGTYSTPTFIVNGVVWGGSDKARLLTEIQAALESE